MANMSLEKAIEHALHIAEICADEECGMQHLQLAEWLTELKTRRDAEQEEITRVLIIKLADGETYLWQAPDFDAYDIKGRFFVVLRDQQWVAMYALDQIVTMEVTE